LMAAAMMAAVVLLAGCQEAAPMEVAQLPATATTTARADTPAPPATAATETKPMVNTATAPVQETKAPVAPTETPIPPASASEAAIAAALAHLAQDLGVAEQDIRVQSVEAVDWPDSSLGCPQPGMAYAQFITPGYRVLLEVDGQAYEMHTDSRQSAVLCEEEGSTVIVPPVPGIIEKGLEPLISLAIKDLADRLSTAEGEIEVLEAIAVVWPDASLGCPQPGMRYKQIPMDGALIRLQAEGKAYEYHSGAGRDPFLCEQPLKIQKDAPPQIDLLQLTPLSPSD
jgi:hypothetical protein